MRLLISSALLLTALAPAFGQAGNSTPVPPKSVPELIDTALRFYNFPTPGMKPWHVQADYQLYDPEGRPTEKGTFEYWWASPTVHRSRWTRPGAQRSEWSTADGKTYVKASGDPLHYLESRMEETLFSPIPWDEIQNPGSTQLALKLLPPKNPDLVCLVVTSNRYGSESPTRNSEPTSAYCFDLSVTGLRSAVRNGLTTEYRDLIKAEGRCLPRQVNILGSPKRTIFSVSVNTFEPVRSTDSNLSPPGNAALETPVVTPREIRESGGTIGSLVKKTVPDYPLMAMMSAEGGRVVLAVDIGKDGKVHNIEVVSSYWPDLAEATVQAVRKWKYKPYLLKSGQPTEVHTLITVVYTSHLTRRLP